MVSPDGLPAKADSLTPPLERGMFKSFFRMGMAHATGVGLAICRNKLYAIWLGAAGIGLLSQLNGYLTLLSSIGLLSASKGISKYVSEFRAKGRIEDVRTLVSSSLCVFTIVSGLILLPGILLSSTVSSLILGDPAYGRFVMLATIPVVLLVWKGVLDALIVGYKDTSSYSRSGIGGNILAFVTLIPLVYFWGIDGAVLGFITTAVLSLLVTVFYAGMAVRPEKLFVRGPRLMNFRLFRPVLYFGIAGVICGAAANLSFLFARRLIIEHPGLGLQGNGVFQAAWGLSHQLLPLVLVCMSVYFYPRLCEISDPKSLGRETLKGLSFAMVLSAPFAALVIAFRYELIRLLYAGGFVGAADSLIFMMLAEYVRIGSWAFSNAMASDARLRVLTATNVAAELVFCACSLLFIGHFGQMGIALSCLVSAAALTASGAVWARCRLGTPILSLFSLRVVLSIILVGGAAVVSLLGFHEKILIPSATGVWIATLLVLYRRRH
ncbi:MAG: hypothetical protein RDV41_06005 [Planctomycetota bacterium]|nr:hypothetical protein [Planctomycetota bacterium]